MRITFGSTQVKRKLGKATVKPLNDVIDVNDPEKSMRGIGEVGLAELKKTFRSNLPPPNAPSTIAKKGEGKNTLFDKGELFRALAFEVRTSGKK